MKTDQLRRPYYGDTVRVVVGENEAEFTVHKNVICSKSLYFVAASSEAWRKDNEGVIRIEEIGAPSFELYTHWQVAKILP